MDYKFVKLVKLKDDKKKYKAVFKNLKNGKEKNVKFGAAGMEDYTMHKDKQRWINFMNRFKTTIKQNATNPLSPMWWSYNLLWFKPSFDDSLKNVKQKLKILKYI